MQRRSTCRAVIHTDGTVTLYVGPEVIRLKSANDFDRKLWNRHRALVPPVRYVRADDGSREAIVSTLAEIAKGGTP